MTLEERFEAIMKNCEHLQARNEEMANQNEYLRRQLGDSLRQKRRELRSSSSSRPPGSVRGKRKKKGPSPEVPKVKATLLGTLGGKVGTQPIPMTLKSTSRSLKVNWIRTLSLSGCKPWRGYLSIRRFRRTRKSSLLPSSFVSMPHYGGQTC